MAALTIHYNNVCDRPQMAHGLVGKEKANQAIWILLERASLKGETDPSLHE